MLRDITIGQYFPGDSVIHKLDPRFKIVITILYIVMLFSGGNYLCLAVGAVFTIGAILLSKIPLKMFVKSVKPLFIFLMITAVINLFFMSRGNVLLHWKFIKITDEGHISSSQYPTLVAKEDLTSLGVEDASNKRNSIRDKVLASTTEYPTEYAVAEIISAVTEQLSDTLASISSRLNVVEEALHIDVDPYYGSGDGVFVGDIE